MSNGQRRHVQHHVQQNGASVALEGDLLCVKGALNATTLPKIGPQLYHAVRKNSHLSVDLSALSHLDTAGAWFLTKFIDEHQMTARSVTVDGLSQEHRDLIKLVQTHALRSSEIPKEVVPSFLEHIGRDSTATLKGYRDFLAFIGKLTFSSIRITFTPAKLRWSSVVKHIEEAGFDALPIVGLLTFLLGVVIAYQGGIALQTYGASIYTADFVGLAMVRELSPLIAAIIVAGRTGSAYTAQIATMKVTEEIDALRTMGISPVEELALPKFFALLVALPLLTVFGDIMGLLGGMVMANSLLDVSFVIYIDRITQTLSPTSIIVGVAKAPVFALMIAAVGCYHGFEVKAGAEQVGRQTTTSVVQSIFLVIVADAVFSIIFSKLGI